MGRLEAMEMVRLGLTETRFDEDPYNRAIEEIVVGLQQAETSAGTIAGRALYDAIYPDHPYARYALPATVQKVTIEDAIARRDAIMAKDNLLVTVVGDIAPDRLKTAMETTFADLPETSDVAEIEDVVLKPAPAEPIVKELPQPQSLVAFTAPGFLRNDPDFFPAYVTNYILGGGGFGSRLMDRIREEKGYVYSIRSHFSARKHPGPFIVSLQTKNESALQAIDETFAVIRQFIEEGATEAELKAAKAYFINSFPLRLVSNRDVAGMLPVLEFYELGLDYPDRYAGIIRAVTLEQVKAATKNHLKPDQFFQVVVADLEKAGLASVPGAEPSSDRDSGQTTPEQSDAAAKTRE